MLGISSLVLCSLLVAADPVEADYVIRGATLYDGSGKAPIQGDIAIKGERIVALGTFALAGKPKIIEGKGLVVAPGFIDLHTHSDVPLTERAAHANLNYLTQGVTTVITGNCGAGPWNVAEYYRQLKANRIGTNVGHQVPHNDVRRHILGNANRAPTAAELKEMAVLVENGMKAGAWGLSTGLIYNPGTYSQTDELIELAKVAARNNGFYASHIRDEGPGLLASIEEALTIGREAKLPVHISHLKAYGRKNWGKTADAVALIQAARDKGQAVTADQYPYTASSTSLAATVIPPQFRAGTAKEYGARLNDPEQEPRIRKAIEDFLGGPEGAKAIRIASYQRKPQWQGKDLAALAEQEKKPVADVVLEIERNGGAQIVEFSMSEEDVRLVMKQPFTATASDGVAQVPSSYAVHPRNYGCFPRKIGKYAWADRIVPPQQAIRSASGLPADILRLPQRGYLKPGYFADVVVFDPQTFRDRATFDKPHQYSSGVRYLFVNGQPALANGKYTGALAGKVLRHQ